MRLIDADKLIEKLEALADSYFYSNCSDFTMGLHNLLRQQGADAAIEVVKKQKSVDPVKHGHWILKHIGAGHTWECSVCHESPCIYITKDTKYCPNCGARMDMEE